MMALLSRHRLLPDGLALLALAAACGVVGHWHVPGPRVAALNLGPNDATYLTGFAPHHEIEDGEGVHWTTHDATVDLPLTVGGPFELAYRFARVLPQTARVRVSVNGVVVDRFECRGGRVLVRRVSFRSGGATPLRVRFEIDSHDRRDLGLRLDWLAASLGPHATLAQRGWAVWRPLLLVVGLFLLFRLVGFPARWALVLAGPVLIVLALSLWRDPLATAHLTRKLTLATLIVTTLTVALLRRRLRGRWLLVIFVASYLLKGVFVFQPGYFYPDVEVHRNFVTYFREANGGIVERGLAVQQKQHQAYRVLANGRGYAFPYSPLFYLPFVATVQGDEPLEDAMRHVALVAAASEVLLVYWLSTLLLGAEAGLWGAFLAAFSPILYSRLLYAMWPTLVGHVLDVVVIGAALVYTRRPGARTFAALAALAVLACLSYIGSLFSVTLFLVSLALLDRRRRLPLLGLAAGAAALTVTLLYGRFVVAFVSEILPLVTGNTARSPGLAAGIWQALGRVPLFWGWAMPILALGGLWLARTRLAPKSWNLLRAYLLTFVALMTLRGLAPALFKDLKESTFVAPLMALLAGLLLSELARRGRREWLAAALVASGLACSGLWRAADYFRSYRSPVADTFVDLRAPSTK